MTEWNSDEGLEAIAKDSDCGFGTPNWETPEARAHRHRGLFEGPSVPRKADWKLRSADEEQAIREAWELKVKPPIYALFKLGEPDKQVSKAHWHKEIVVIEAYEMGLINRHKADRWLTQGYEIREL